MKKALLIPPLALAAVIALLFAGLSTGLIGSVGPSGEAQEDIPSQLLPLYVNAADTCPGLSWTILAAIGKIETNHGRSTLPGVTSGANSHGAAGPMQFGVGGKAGNTWAAYGIDGDGDGVADVYNPFDAVFSAAHYLCSHGARGGENLYDAVFAYNHADWYVQDVMAQAAQYAAAPALTAGSTDVHALLGTPRVNLTEGAHYDLELSMTRPGWIDPRVIAMLHLLSQDHTLSVSVLRTGHTHYVAGTERVSNHAVGRGIDIYELDGQPVSADNQAARAVVEMLVHGQGPLRPDEVGSPFAEFAPLPGAFTDAGHQGHIHIGWGDN